MEGLVPPDGGWGWMIVAASSVSNFITIPIMQSFGLLFRDKFEEIKLTATDQTIIVNVNSAFGMGLGLLNGPLLRKFGYRKVAFVAALTTFTGVLLTSWADSFIHFLITYSFITSLGMALLMASFSLAVNSYFRVRRGRATGLAMAFMGLGPVIMPLVITVLLNEYRTQGAVMIIAGISLHSVAAALLLQPVSWHMKPAPPRPEEETDLLNGEIAGMSAETTENESKITKQEQNTTKRHRALSVTESSADLYNPDVDSQSVYGFETPLVRHRKFGSNLQIAPGAKRKLSFARSISQQEEAMPAPMPAAKEVKEPWWKAVSIETINLGSSVKIFEEKPHIPLTNLEEEQDDKQTLDNGSKKEKSVSIAIAEATESDKDGREIDPEETKRNGCAACLHWVVEFFDLDLLKDSHYVSLMIGMSLAVCAEINFSLNTPFILKDFGFDKEQTAVVMAIIGIADIIFRFLSPYVGDFFEMEAQPMYLISLCMLVTARVSLTFFNDYKSAMAVAVILGISKGFRTVYMTLVIPNYVPIERLAGASGLQMVVNGMFIMASIPLMGVIRDSSGSYTMCIWAINAITMITIIMWTAQILRAKLKKSR